MGRLDVLKVAGEQRGIIGLPLGRGKWEGFINLVRGYSLREVNESYRLGDVLVLKDVCNDVDFTEFRFQVLAVLVQMENGEVVLLCRHLRSSVILALDSEDLGLFVVDSSDSNVQVA